MDFSQKNGIGLIFVKDMLSPSSPFGKEKINNIEIYCRGQEKQLLCELNNVEKAAKLLRTTPSAFNILKHIFSQTKDIRGSIKQLSEAKTMDEVELFEIRRLSELSAQISVEFNRINSIISFEGISFSSLAEVCSILSSESKGGFMISSKLSEKLELIRNEKSCVNKKLALCKDDENKKLLTERHLSLAVDEQKEEAIVRAMLSSRLMPYANGILKNIANIAALDLIIEKAQLAVLNNCVKPDIGDTLSFIGAYNPLICSNLEKDGNTFSPLSADGENGVTVITGANMGGKTTALKTIALNVYLALSGFFVFARSASVPFFDFIDIISDNLQSDKRGLSSFGGEIVRLDALYKRVKNEYGLILFDEFASGTNADEGIKLFNATVKAFNNCRCMIFMTTHYDNATKFSKSHYQVTGLRYANFNAIKDKLKVNRIKSTEIISEFMDYGLVKMDTNAKIPKEAIIIAEMLGLDDDILKNLDS